MSIPDEAVEAAVGKVLEAMDANRSAYQIAYTALEAAAPFIAAQAWDEGDRNGRSRAMRMMSDEPNLPLLVPNPYRSGT